MVCVPDSLVRAAQMAEQLNLDRERVLGWGLAQAVFAAWWSIEGGGQVREQPLACAELLAGITLYSNGQEG